MYFYYKLLPSCDERWLIQRWNFNRVYIGILRGKTRKKLLKGKTREFWTYYLHSFPYLTGETPALVVNIKPFLHSAAGCWVFPRICTYMQKSTTCWLARAGWVFPHAAVSSWECYIANMYKVFLFGGGSPRN